MGSKAGCVVNGGGVVWELTAADRSGLDTPTAENPNAVEIDD